MRQPQLVADMVAMSKSKLGPAKPVSIKIRLDSDPQHTVALVRMAAAAKADYVSIHGRTRYQASTHPVDEEGLAFAADIARTCGLPSVANGDAWTLEDAQRIRKKCKVQAVMSARGLLANPALFSGYASTPDEAAEVRAALPSPSCTLNSSQRFFGYAIQSGLPFALGHHHLSYMLESRFAKPGALHPRLSGRIGSEQAQSAFSSIRCHPTPRRKTTSRRRACSSDGRDKRALL